jgi:F-type H+-transporting ATPase subunit b
LRSRQSRFAAPIFNFALLAALSVGIAMTPARALAQESAPAPAVSASAAPAPTEATAAAKDEKGEDATEAFRHTPLMTSIAKALHLSVDTTATLFEVFNFAIIFFGIGIPLVRFLPRHLSQRKQVLSQNLESARKTTADASARLSAVEAQLSHLDEEIAKIRAQVEEESKQDEVRIKSAIEAERARIVAAAEQEINVAAAQARRGLRHFAADLAIDQAARQLNLTPEIDRALIAEFVTNASANGANVGAPSGGKN